MKRILLVLAVLALVAADANAGPILNRLREKRASHGTCSTGCTAAPAQQVAPTAKPVQVATVSGVRTAGYTVSSGCASGNCAVPSRFVLPVK